MEWQNSRLATGSIAEETARLKQVSGDGRIYVGGSQLGASFLEQGLVDELHFILTILTPILLGKGNTVLDGIKKRYPLRLLSTKTFQSGNMLLIYEPSLR